MAYNVYFVCDKCGATYSWVNFTVTYCEAIRYAREKGWQVGKRGWFCADCRPRKRRRKADGWVQNAPTIIQAE